MRKIIHEVIITYFHSVSTPNVFVSEPIFRETPEKVYITIFYYRNSRKKMEKDRIINLITILTRSIHKEISVDFIRIRYPYMNSSIFARYLCHNANAHTFLHFRNSILKYPKFAGQSLPSHICGVRIQLSGRIITERVIPRVTKNVAVFGSLAKADSIDYGYYTTKNYMGSFTVKV